MKQEKNQDDGFFNIMLFGAGAFLLVKAFDRAVPFVSHFWEMNRTRILIGGTLALIGGMTALVTYLWNRYQDVNYEVAVTAQDDKAIPLGVDEREVS